MKRLGDTCVLDGLTFEVPTGSTTGLLGPNGAGKSTTMRVLATLLRPDEGRVVVGGTDVVDDTVAVRRMIGLVTEEPGLFDRLTVREQLRFTGRAYGMDEDEVHGRTEQLTGALVLGPELDKRAGALSKGNRQKVALARALIHDPPVLLLDEPTAGLDVMATAGFEDLVLRGDLTGDRTVLLSTHRLDEAERLADRVVGIVEGHIVAVGTPDELVERTQASSFRDAFVSVMGGAAVGATTGR
ncbi:MAG: ABC transporter ATP-binding protein [Acidimicrobiia bacterium]|nr:ABC transporter ATP-binding protein [Acidimicrobiia bacterium]